MSGYDKMIFADNDIVCSNESNELYCSICTTNVYNVDWEKHVKSPTHVVTLIRFNANFKDCGEKIHCNFCNEDLSWKSLKQHGKSHMIVPWHEPDDKYKIFFDNRIILCKKEFYCCTCEIKFPEWSTAFVHVSEPQHKKFHDKSIAMIEKISLPMTNGVTHELLVSEAIVIHDSTTLTCKICESIVAFPDVIKHVKSFYHFYYRFKSESRSPPKINDSRMVELPKNFESIGLENSTIRNISDDENGGTLFSCDYIEKQDARYSKCVICDCLINNHETKNHREEKCHEDAKTKHGCENIIVQGDAQYYCKCCNCRIDGNENLYLHVKERKHLNFMSRISEKYQIPKDHEETLKISDKMAATRETSSHWSIASTNNGDSQSTKSDHVVSPFLTVVDLKTTKKSESNAPAIKEHENVQSHIPKIISLVSSTISYSKPLKTIENPAKFEIDEIQKNPTSKINDNCIVRKNATEAFCHICNAILSGNGEIDNHVEGAQHETEYKRYGYDYITFTGFNNNYHCACCNCKIPGFPNVCLHVKGKKHTLLLLAKREEEKKIDDKAMTISQPELSKLVSTVITTEFAKLIEQFGLKNILTKRREKSRYGRTIVNKSSVAEIQQISCNYCTVVVENSAELHSHLASHLSHDFVNSKIVNNANTTEYSDIVRKGNSVASKTTVVENSNKNNEISTNRSVDDNMNCTSPEIEKPRPLNLVETSESENEQSSKSEEKKTILQKIRRRLNFDKNYIYDINEKLKTIELGMKLCFVNDTKNIYCLVCRKIVANTLQSYFEHLSNLDHSATLETIEKDHELFIDAEGQFSELDLVSEYMEEKSDEIVHCLVCDEDIVNVDYYLREHIDAEKHEIICREMHINAKQNFDDVKIRMQCDWYNVHKYWCVPCSAYFESEVNFVRHLETSFKHRFTMKKVEKLGRRLIYDFCPPCALLWYGYRCTYPYHCEVPSHKWLVRDGHYSLPDLPETMKNLLAEPEQYVNDTIALLEEEIAKEGDKEQSLIDDLENSVRMEFLKIKAHAFGSRIMGLSSTYSDLDVFLDCGNMYDGKLTSENRIAHLMTIVHQCLSIKSHSWETEEPVTKCQEFIIKAYHRATGISCNISFENGLSVETTKLIKCVNDVFPPCRKLILFLKQWLVLCNLSSCERISNYALYWFVIFYLQKESILPSIATLIVMKKKSHVIAGWEVGVSYDFAYNEVESNYSLKELLIRFFTFYADFDFRYNVACPLIGEAVKKRLFVNPEKLPKEMSRYVDYMKNSSDPDPLRVDSPMCIQDPFDLQHNLTKTVSKVYLSRFRTYCSKSLDVLLGSS